MRHPIAPIVAALASLVASGCGVGQVESEETAVATTTTAADSIGYVDEVLPPGVAEDHPTDDFQVAPEQVPGSGSDWQGLLQLPQKVQVVYLNFDGVTLQYAAPDDATRNRSTLLYRLVDADFAAAWAKLKANGYAMDVHATLPAFDHSSFGRDRATVLAAIAAQVRADLANFNVTVTTTRPTAGAYTMAVVGGTSAAIGAPANYIGLSPLDVDNANASDVVLVFPRAWGDTAAVAKVIDHELGHAFGLYHTQVANGIMSPSLLKPYASQKFNEGAVIKDGVTTHTPPDWQRDLATLLRALGPAAGCYSRFADVTAGHAQNEPIGTLACAGVLSGFPDGLFHPASGATRAQLAAVAVRTLEYLVASPASARFPDVPRSHWAFASVETSTSHGVFSGYPDGTFRPEAAVTRAELAAISVRMAGWTSSTSTCGTAASDVPASHWACRSVEAALEAGAMQLDADGSFAPGRSATRAEVAGAFAAVWMR